MDWIPEAKSPSGGLAAEGFYKLLGRPRLDPLTVLVRETAQNSWDARLDSGDVDFTIEGWHLRPDERHTLSTEVFVNATEARGTGLADALAKEELVGFFIADRNTKGLGGPFQADHADPDETYDWVDFVLNVGEANTQGHTGGTYGFGKTISYVVSAANAVVIHSRTFHKGRPQSRLIACAIGEKFARGQKLFTGRHWWGVAEGEVPHPLTGQAADDLARAIGMPEFGPRETGTNLLVLDPDLGGRSPEQAMRFIAESVTWHLWPKLMRRPGKRSMDIAVTWDGAVVPIPRPDERPPLHGFAQAFQAILDGDQGDRQPPGLRIDRIQCRRPVAEVGTLATMPLVHRDRIQIDDGSDLTDSEAPQPAAAITGVCHHVALLRTPELVVEYFQGPAPPEGGVEWAGVFRAADAQDEHFAAAEPPTHDSWNPELLPKSPGRVIVNVGLREIRAALERRWSQRKAPAHVDIASTALVADELAHLVGPLEARGRGRRRKEPASGGRPSARPRVDIFHSEPIDWQGDLATLARVRVTPVPRTRSTSFTFSIAAALDGRSADVDLDPELALVQVLVDGSAVEVAGKSGVVRIDSSRAVEVDLIARRGAETTVLFDVEAESLR